MPEIGETLRETRMRRGLDIMEVEAATKIRTKYLRALENEEWHLLPGPTFARTFLRTYAEYLELDPRGIVEEYRRRTSEPAPQELMPFGTRLGGRRRPPRHGRNGPSPGIVLGVVLVALVGLLFAIGKLWPADDEQDAAAPGGSAVEVEEDEGRGGNGGGRRGGGDRQRARRQVTLRIVPTGTVSVCLVDARGRRLIDDQALIAGSPTPRFRSRRFRLSLGNGQARLRVGGRTIDVPDRSTPIGYDIRPRRAVRETENRPSCS